MNKLNISVVIPVSNDLRLFECIKSIDEKVEVVVSLNRPSKILKKELNKFLKNNNLGLKIKICEIKEASIAGAYNNGIKNASHDLILLMDSDCKFDKGCIQKLYSNMNDNLLSKGKVIFTYNSFITKIVSLSREFHTSDKISAYSPPLLFHKKIKSLIGDYYFHPKLCWLEDSEFDSRVQKAHLGISYDSSAVVFHPPLTPFRDLKSSFWYGVGKRIGYEIGIHEKPTGILGSFKKYVIEASKVKGFLAGFYLFVWKLTLMLGYYLQAIFKIR